LEALESLNFTKPTPIQEKALPFGLSGRDVIGTAETGSGKTLAFGIPILQYLLAMNEKERECELAGLILAPTRELAIQVKDHLKDIGKHARLKVSPAQFYCQLFSILSDFILFVSFSFSPLDDDNSRWHVSSEAKSPAIAKT